MKSLLARYGIEGFPLSPIEMLSLNNIVCHCLHQGVFIFGNALRGERHLSSLLYSRLVALNSPVFDFAGCNYTEKNMSRPVCKHSRPLACACMLAP